MLNRQPYGILVVSDDSRGEFANQTFCDMFGLNEKPEALVGLSSEEIIRKIHPAYVDPETVTAMIATVVSRNEPFHDYEIATKDGRVMLLDFEPLIINGKTTGRIWIHRDFTERKQIEEKLKQKMHDLERFNALTVDRELRMVELKKEVNAMLETLGKKPKYKIAE